MRRLTVLVLGCLMLPGAYDTASCGPVLNEIMADPARDWDGDGTYDYKDDEWIEIFNPGPSPVDLTGYALGDEARAVVFGFSGVLPAAGHRVVFGSEVMAYQQSHGLGAYGLRLGNDGDSVTLLQVSGGDTLLVDAYTYNTYEAEDDRSSGRDPDGGVSWALYDALNRYSGATPPLGNGLAPTPGQPNGEPMVPVAQSTWGCVKALYR